MLIWGVVKLSATSDHLPYLCPTRLLALATPLGLVLSVHVHNIEYYGFVKVVNNASGTRLAGSYS